MERIPTHIFLSAVPYLEQPFSTLLRIREVSREWATEFPGILFRAYTEFPSHAGPLNTFENFAREKDPRTLLRHLQALYRYWYINRSILRFHIKNPTRFFTGFYQEMPTTPRSEIQYSIQFVFAMKHLAEHSEVLVSSFPTLYRPDFIHQLFQVIAYELQEMADEIPPGVPMSVVYRPIGLRHPTIVQSPFYHTYRMFNFLLAHGYMYRSLQTERDTETETKMKHTTTTTPTTTTPASIFSTENQRDNIRRLHADITNEPHRFKGTLDFLEALSAFREQTLGRGDSLIGGIEYMVSMRRIFCSILLTLALDVLPLIQTGNLTFLDQHRDVFARLIRLMNSERTAILMQGRKYLEYTHYVQMEEIIAILTNRFYCLAPISIKK